MLFGQCRWVGPASGARGGGGSQRERALVRKTQQLQPLYLYSH
jgi:hypothetical protein